MSKPMYEDLSGLPSAARKVVARERWQALPSVLKDIFAHAPKWAMYEALRSLKVETKPTRSVEWSYPMTDGSLVVTIWHDQIQPSEPPGSLVYYVPVERWRGHGPQAGRAEDLGEALERFAGKNVKALLLRHEWDVNDTQFAKSVAVDQRSWWVEALGENTFLLWRGGKK